MIISCSAEENISALEINFAKGAETLIFRPAFSHKGKNTVQVLTSSAGKVIEDIYSQEYERAVFIKLSGDAYLVISFVPGKKNVFYVEDGIVRGSFKSAGEYSGKSMEEIFKKRVSDENNTITSYLHSFNHFGKEIKEEVISKLELDKSAVTTSETKSKIDIEFASIKNTILSSPQFIVYYNYNSAFISLYKLGSLNGYRLKEFININEALKHFVYLNKIKFSAEDVKKNKAAAAEREVKHYEHKIENLNKQLQHAQSSIQYKQYGDMLLANLNKIKEGSDEFTTEGITIKLNSKLSASENAQKYYEKYKSQKASIPELEKKVKEMRMKLISAKDELVKIQNETDEKKLLKMKDSSEKEDNPDLNKFRKIPLNEEYEVWVGKDSAANDILTTKYTHQNELWFHARGASGSHTVLKMKDKKAEPGKELILKAASIAAYYSKARNASNVPVAYCQKKYVKKKKGFKTGSVVMEREKVVFVKPELPG